MITRGQEINKWLEIGAVVLTGVLKFILADWLGLRTFYIIAACFFWIIFVYTRYKNDPLVLKRWGFRKGNFFRSLRFLSPFALIVAAGIVIYGLVTQASFLDWHILPILALYPLWGTVQQFIVAGLLVRNVKSLSHDKISDLQVNLLISLGFAIVHFPDIHLMVFALVMEFVFISAQDRLRNIAKAHYQRILEPGDPATHLQHFIGWRRSENNMIGHFRRFRRQTYHAQVR